MASGWKRRAAIRTISRNAKAGKGATAFRSSAPSEPVKGGAKPASGQAASAKLTYKDARRLDELTRLMPERRAEIVAAGRRDGRRLDLSPRTRKASRPAPTA